MVSVIKVVKLTNQITVLTMYVWKRLTHRNQEATTCTKEVSNGSYIMSRSRKNLLIDLLHVQVDQWV